MEKWHGRQITAARALAGLTIIDLAKAAKVTDRTIRRIEAVDVVKISDQLTHGAISRDTWNKVIDALNGHGVELVAPQRGAGAGVRWSRSR